MGTAGEVTYFSNNGKVGCFNLSCKWICQTKDENNKHNNILTILLQ